ncbi:MAG TPA: hypothetical protein VK465_10620 [Fibrobacteria bacterium]|nr:hypothetical protein [Fibrobacteria bacterium]
MRITVPLHIRFLGTIIAFEIIVTFISVSVAAAASSPILFSSDLEEQDSACWASRPRAGCRGWTGIRDGCFDLRAGEKSRSGSKSLRIAFAKNEDFGGAYRQVSSRHVFTRFHDYYEMGFDFAAGMKIHRLSAFNAATEKNDFDIVLQLKADEPGMNHCGPTDSKWLALSYNGGPVDWGSVEGRFTPVRGRWYLVETEIKLNTPGASDGEVRAWVDGKVILEKRGMDLTGEVASPINSVLFGGWYSNSAAGRNPCPDPVRPSLRYIDDPAIATSYIGPVPEVAPGPVKGTRRLTAILPWPGSLRAEFGPTLAYGSVAGPESSSTGRFELTLAGLDTNRAYHFRLRGTLASGTAYMSPDMTLSTRPEAARPRKPFKPGLPTPDSHDPIPD